MFKSFKFVILAVSLSACMGDTGSVDYRLIDAGTMPQGVPAEAPHAFRDYCKRQPEDCKVQVTGKFTKALDEINQQALELVVPTPDEGEYWLKRETVGPGDCEDFALTIRHLLRTRFPEHGAAFRLATAFTEDGQYHAVLSIDTNRGTLVCDIRYTKCQAWAEFPYQWKMREVVGAEYWEDVSPALMQVKTAAYRHARR